eukprot:403357023
MFKYFQKTLATNAYFVCQQSQQQQSSALKLISTQMMNFATQNFTNNVIVDPNRNAYQESQMLFFADPNPQKKHQIVKPRTVRDIKKIQSFVKEYRSEPGKSLNESIKSMAQRDESFNEFLKNFKAKNEQNWSNIVDLTQEEQEARLLEKSPDYRKNEMVMMEEFRRRKNLQRYFEMTSAQGKKDREQSGQKSKAFDMSDDAVTKESQYRSAGPERFFTPSKGECFDPSQFELLFIDSDSVTNVTSLNRTNHRRILLFIGNGNGVISFGMGKGVDYEQAFESAYKKLRTNLMVLPMHWIMTSPLILKGRHNDYHIKILPQQHPNYWGHPVIHKMLITTGFYHCRFAVKSRKRDPYSMIYAFVQAVSKNLSLDDISQMKGIKTHQISFGNPTTSNSDKIGELF